MNQENQGGLSLEHIDALLSDIDDQISSLPGEPVDESTFEDGDIPGESPDESSGNHDEIVEKLASMFHAMIEHIPDDRLMQFMQKMIQMKQGIG